MGFFDKALWEPKTIRLPTIPECGKCGLSSKCQSPKIKVQGLGKRKILIIGEQPSRGDDREGSTPTGEYGRLLTRLLDNIGVELEDCWFTNSIICHSDDPVIDEAIECCRPNLFNLIKDLEPKVVILMGISPVKSLIKMEYPKNIGTEDLWVGWQIPSKKFNTWLCPTYGLGTIHYRNQSVGGRIKNDEALMKIVQGHLEKAFALESVEPCPLDPDALGANCELITDVRLAKLRMKDLSRKSGLLSFDYETNCLKPEPAHARIHSVSFCLDGVDTFSCTIGEHNHRVLRKVLLNEKLLKISHNFAFEFRTGQARLGVETQGCHWDTMLAAHLIDNRTGITGLKFQAYVNFGVGDYSSSIKPYLASAKTDNDLNTIDKAPVLDVLKYCALDSLFAFKLYLKQREIMGFK